MLVIKVELHSAIDGRTEELGRLTIANVGGTRTQGNYDAVAMRKRPRGKEPYTREECAMAVTGRLPSVVSRDTHVAGYARIAEPVWNLVAKALKGMGYG